MKCLTCSYDLRGLPSDRPCPECGTLRPPIETGGRLSVADPLWLRKVCLGLALFIHSTRAFLLSAGVNFLAGIALYFVSTFTFRPWTQGELVLNAMLVLSALALLVALTGQIFGVFQITAREPGWTPLKTRKLCHATQTSAAMTALIAGPFLIVLLRARGQLLSTISILMLIAAVAGFTTTVLLVLRRLMQLADRAQDRDLALLLQIQFHFGTIIAGIFVLLTSITLILGQTSAAAIVGVAFLMASFVLAGWTIATTRAMAASRRIFLRCIALAREPIDM